ncbi:hypothetical protein E5340_00780 [Ligilactobacillus murinus]|uniref:Uncharacterized protein n=1 Tax=Ligilactobacillus murinus TaxID=1622 RepID=A0A4S2ERU7_9LACO|nr:hypothetical protein [Ligilactobacillus murinus]TGY57234.1 hypothetical protein E5340_00780 [Ligilactobacillus murinus]
MSELKRIVKAAETFLKIEGATNVIVIATDDDDVSVTTPKDSHVAANLIMFALDDSSELTKEIVKNFLMMGGHLS